MKVQGATIRRGSWSIESVSLKRGSDAAVTVHPSWLREVRWGPPSLLPSCVGSSCDRARRRGISRVFFFCGKITLLFDWLYLVVVGSRIANNTLCTRAGWLKEFDCHAKGIAFSGF